MTTGTTHAAGAPVDLVQIADRLGRLLALIPNAVRFSAHGTLGGPDRQPSVSITVTDPEPLYLAARDYPGSPSAGLARFGSGLCWVGEFDGLTVLLHTETPDIVPGQVSCVTGRWPDMSVVAVAVFLAALVGLLLKTNQLGPCSAVVCVVLGLVIAATPAGPTITGALNQTGSWAWAQVRSL